jgi:hypothetical protein
LGESIGSSVVDSPGGRAGSDLGVDGDAGSFAWVVASTGAGDLVDPDWLACDWLACDSLSCDSSGSVSIRCAFAGVVSAGTALSSLAGGVSCRQPAIIEQAINELVNSRKERAAILWRCNTEVMEINRFEKE